MSRKDDPGLAATSNPGVKESLLAHNNTPEGREWKCHCCGHPLPFQSLEWRHELPLQIARYAGSLGVTPELAGLSLIELYGVYRYLNDLGGSL